MSLFSAKPTQEEIDEIRKEQALCASLDNEGLILYALSFCCAEAAAPDALIEELDERARECLKPKP